MLPVTLGLGLVFLLVAEGGFHLGRWHILRGDTTLKEHIGALQSALMGLMALMLAFTFAMAVSRYDERKALVVDEANAIGTTWLRARLLNEPYRSELLRLLPAYVDARIAFYDAAADRKRIDATHGDAMRLQEKLWGIATEVVREQPRAVPEGLFIQTLNDVIDLSEKRLQSLDNTVPGPVIYLLLVAAAVAVGFVGYGSGVAGKRHFVSVAITSILIAFVLTVIIDLDRPRRGVIRSGQDSMYRLKDSIAQPPR
jgi:hypothetical protein